MPPQQPVHDLPERLALPLQTGEPWWYWLGGRPALDLVNTLRERWRRRVETLVTTDDLAVWLERAGGATRPPPLAGTPQGLAQAPGPREAIDARGQGAGAGPPPPPPPGRP